MPLLSHLLLPKPRQLRETGHTLPVADQILVRSPAALDAAANLALDQLRAACADTRGPVSVRVLAPTDTVPDGATRLTITPFEHPESPPADGVSLDCATQSYQLSITPAEIALHPGGSAGLAYGLRTLCQIARLHGRKWPCLEIDDAPSFALRGLSYDVSRGKVPTLETLQLLADRLALLKVNHLQLYIEHTFAWRFNPAISRDCSPLTPDEIRTLDDYCRQRYIDLVPSLACFGHMGRVLSLPEYRHLAEVEASQSFDDMSWTTRMRGLTLDATNPESRTLIEQMCAELLPCFSSPLVNVCCDETYDLGKGKTQAVAAQRGVGEIYLDHLAFLHDLCRRHGKRMMFWGDILKKYPDVLRRVPRDAIALNWDYAPDCDYQSTQIFRDAGLTTAVCPATHGWNRIVNDLHAAETNIRGHARAGEQLGAIGLLNTDWGDEGHVNLLACSWPPIAAGAALAWNAGDFDERTFDAAVARLLWNGSTAELPAELRRVAGATQLLRAWPKFCEPLSVVLPVDELSDEQLDEWRRVSRAAQARFVGVTSTDEETQCDMRELAVACRFAELLAERFSVSRQLAASDAAPNAELKQRLVAFATMCDELIPPYREVWLARNKPNRLHEIVAVLERLAAEARTAAGVSTK